MRLFLSVFFYFLMLIPTLVYAQRVSQQSALMQVFPNKDGEFSAILMILDNASMKEFAKPSDQGLHLSGKKMVKRDEKVNIVVGFTGMGLTSDLEANVTFDFSIINAEGIVVNEAKDIIAIQEKITHPMMVFHSRSEVAFAFDETDKPGLYSLRGTARDNVAKKSVPLEASIELVE